MGRATRAGGDQRRAGAGGPATRWIRSVSRASARVMAGSMVVRRRPNLALSTPPRSIKGLWADRLHPLLQNLRPTEWGVAQPNSPQMAMDLNSSAFGVEPPLMINNH